MEDINGFLNNAAERGITKWGSRDHTKKILSHADILLEAAIVDKDRSLHKKIHNGLIKREYISTAYVEENWGEGPAVKRPVVDLVQQGGGMYGIALLGYTYIMEKIGIRFYSHGGTSAGAINASFLAAIDNKIYEQKSVFDESRFATKSEILTHIIANTEFSSFMGKTGIIGRLQRMLFRNFKSLALKLIVLGFMLGFLVIIYSAFGFLYKISHGLSGFELRYFDFIIGTTNVIALVIILYILFVKVLGVRFGINSGNEFYEWVDGLLDLIHIHTTDDLYERMQEMTIEPARPDDAPRLVLISSNLTHNRIAKFPERAGDYWEDFGNIKPAAYLRATMSLPFIFKTFIPSIVHYNDPHPADSVKLKARFVDGGMLSNFPIREFHTSNPNPRFPTFGVLLSDIGLNKPEAYEGETDGLPEITLIEYVSSFFKTFRNFYDYEFIFNSKEIRDRVVTVNTKNFNWLDFWMDEPTQKKLFLVGVKAAIRQIDKFNWSAYETVREQMVYQHKYMKK